MHSIHYERYLFKQSKEKSKATLIMLDEIIQKVKEMKDKDVQLIHEDVYPIMQAIRRQLVC